MKKQYSGMALKDLGEFRTLTAGSGPGGADELTKEGNKGGGGGGKG